MVDWDKYKLLGFITRVEGDSVHVRVVDPETGVDREEILDRKKLGGPAPEPRDEVWTPIITDTEKAKPAPKKTPAKKKMLESLSKPEKKKASAKKKPTK